VNGRKMDLDFLATTQARETDSFLQIKRAQWIGDVLGEERAFGLLSDNPAFWNGVALYLQRAIVEEAKAVTLAAVGEDIGESNEPGVEDSVEATSTTEEEQINVVGGTITIPAAACSKPTENTGKIIFMPSNQGGMQLHYKRTGGHEVFEYTFEAPAAGKYALNARVVTPSWRQHLLVKVNGDEQPIDVELPHTVGMWDQTEPVEITLVKGQNVLSFSREGDAKGLTIKDFTLKPIK